MQIVYIPLWFLFLQGMLDFVVSWDGWLKNANSHEVMLAGPAHQQQQEVNVFPKLHYYASISKVLLNKCLWYQSAITLFSFHLFRSKTGNSANTEIRIKIRTVHCVYYIILCVLFLMCFYHYKPSFIITTWILRTSSVCETQNIFVQAKLQYYSNIKPDFFP